MSDPERALRDGKEESLTECPFCGNRQIGLFLNILSLGWPFVETQSAQLESLEILKKL